MKASPRMARVINDRLALDLLLERGPLTAPQLRALTGLSRPTVSDLIERLRVNGLIEVAGESGDDRRGPNARLYRIVPGQAHVAGVDVRRSAVNVTVADITGEPIGRAVRSLGDDLGDDLGALIAGAVAEAAGPAAMRTLRAVTIGTPGMVDPHTGDLTVNRHLPSWRPSLLPALRQSLDAEVIVENEVNLAAVAEHAAGAARGRDDFALLWLEEGTGGAVMLGGRLRRGLSGGAGEIGYLPMGDRHCGEIVPDAAFREQDPEGFAVKVAQAALALVLVVDPGLVVLGGAISRAGGDTLAGRVGRHLTALSPVPVQVRITETGDNPILEGAVLTALALARTELFGPPA